MRNVSDRAVGLAAVVLGFRWTGREAGALRFLRHGWQSWSFTGGRALDERGEPEFPSGPWLRGLHHAVGAPPRDRSGWHESDLLTAIGASPSGPAFSLGALERGRRYAEYLAEAQRIADELGEPGPTRRLDGAAGELQFFAIPA